MSENYIEMPLHRLNERGKELSASLRGIDHCSERKAQIQYELGQISFELYCRYNIGELVFENV